MRLYCMASNMRRRNGVHRVSCVCVKWHVTERESEDCWQWPIRQMQRWPLEHAASRKWWGEKITQSFENTWRKSFVWAVDTPISETWFFFPRPVDQHDCGLGERPINLTSCLWTVIDRMGHQRAVYLYSCVIPQLLLSLRLGWRPSESGTSEIVAKRGSENVGDSQTRKLKMAVPTAVPSQRDIFVMISEHAIVCVYVSLRKHIRYMLNGNIPRNIYKMSKWAFITLCYKEILERIVLMVCQTVSYYVL